MGRDDAALALVVTAGLVLRVLYVLAHADHPLNGDGLEYYHSARLFSEGKGFIRPLEYILTEQTIPAAQHPPAWVVAIAPLSLLRVHGLLAHQLWASVIGAAVVAMVGLAGRRLAGPRAGLIAAGIAAVYPNFWMYESVLLSEPLTFLLTALSVFVAYGFWAQPGRWSAVAVGFVCGLLALTRAEAVLLVVLLLVPLTLFTREADRRTRVAWLGLAVGAAMATIAPWVIHNSMRFEHPVLLGTNLGPTLAAANCDEVYDGSRIGWWSFECAVDSMSAVGDVGDASSLDLALRRRGTEYARDHADRLPLVLLAREGRTWGLFQPFQQARLDWIGNPNADIAVLGAGAYWLLLPAAVAGGVVLRRRGSPLFPLLAFVPIVIAATVLTYGTPRYRALVEVPIVLSAAVAVDSWLRPSRQDRGVRSVPAEISSTEPREPVGV